MPGPKGWKGQGWSKNPEPVRHIERGFPQGYSNTKITSSLHLFSRFAFPF